jgi:type IV secretory pathway VirB6-like protein
MEKLNSVNRKNLGFVSSVKTYFNFLISDYGFKCTKNNDYYVCYETSKIRFEIYHERISYEIYVNIINKPSKETPEFSTILSEIIDFLEVDKKKTEFQASNETSINNCVKILSEYLKEYGIIFLNNDTKKIHELYVFLSKKS